jgi:hypothetical protein
MITKRVSRFSDKIMRKIKGRRARSVSKETDRALPVPFDRLDIAGHTD